MAASASLAATTRRGAWMLAIALVVLAVTFVAGVGAARAAQAGAAGGSCDAPAVSQYLAANASEAGVIRLIFFDAEGSPVEYSECIDGRLQRVGTMRSAPTTMTMLTTTWSCARAERHFVAAATLPNGTRAVGSFGVRTPSCAHRFRVSVPRRVKPGSTARVRVVDTWGIGGIRPRLCIAPPNARRACRTLAFARAVAVSSRRFRPAVRGRWRIELRVGTHRVRATVAVGAGAAAATKLPTLLATGDSTMQGVDNFLADELGDEVDVRSDVRPGTGISKLNPWARIAARDARELKPDATVISIGANDAWPMTTDAGAEHACCDEPWVAEYAVRVRSMMRSYLRRGRGRVIWLTLPVPRDPRRVLIFAAVNHAVLRAATGLSGVTIMRMDKLFSPGGYRETIAYRGNEVDVREPDGIHLNVSGTAIAAKAIVDELRGR